MATSKKFRLPMPNADGHIVISLFRESADAEEKIYCHTHGMTVLEVLAHLQRASYIMVTNSVHKVQIPEPQPRKRAPK